MEQILQNPNIFIVFAIWEVIWKGIAMWIAAQNCHKYWFIAILLLNTIGILPIIYLLYIKYWRKNGKQCCCDGKCCTGKSGD